VSKDWDLIEDYSSDGGSTLNWKDLNPFRFFIEIESVEPGEYSDWLIKGKAKIKASDSRNTDPFPADEFTDVSFFTKTVIVSRLKNLYGDNWPEEVVGHVFFVNYQGIGKSNKGRDMYKIYIGPIAEEAEQTVLDARPKRRAKK